MKSMLFTIFTSDSIARAELKEQLKKDGYKLTIVVSDDDDARHYRLGVICECKDVRAITQQQKVFESMSNIDIVAVRVTG